MPRLESLSVSAEAPSTLIPKPDITPHTSDTSQALTPGPQKNFRERFATMADGQKPTPAAVPENSDFDRFFAFDLL